MLLEAPDCCWVTRAGPRWWQVEMVQEEPGMGSSQGLLTGCCHQAGGLPWEGTGC